VLTVKRLLKILGYTIGGLIALAVIAYGSFWLMLAWHMSPRSWNANDNDFDAVAVKNLPGLTCGSLPSGFRVTHYFRQNNFNDGDELWRLELDTASNLSKLTKQLRMKQVIPHEHVTRFLGVLDNKPDWVSRPGSDTKLLFIDADKQTSISPTECKFGIFYLWSNDNSTFFLYHIIT
jgi:hypothetical protein